MALSPLLPLVFTQAYLLEKVEHGFCDKAPILSKKRALVPRKDKNRSHNENTASLSISEQTTFKLHQTLHSSKCSTSMTPICENLCTPLPPLPPTSGTRALNKRVSHKHGV